LEYDEDGNPIKKRETDPKKEEYYLQDLPLTPGAIDTSNAIIARDLYEVGFIYQDLLNDIPRTCASFESLLKRFPESEYALPCTFLLYSIYLKQNDPKNEHYKQILLTKYPDTDYAKLIQDPDYYKKLASQEKVVVEKYAEVYDDYQNRQWGSVVRKSDEAMPQCQDGELKSKFAYLRAVAAGQVYNEDSLIVGLRNVISQYGQYEVAELARIYLSTFDAQKLAATLSTTTDSTQTSVASLIEIPQNNLTNPFVVKDDEMHYVVLLVKTANLPVQDVKLNLTNFNKTNFSLQRLNLSSFYINNTQQMVTVAKFKNKTAAVDYYHILVKDNTFAPDISNGNIEVYAMSATNYTTFYNNKDGRALYNDFFKDNYLKQK